MVRSFSRHEALDKKGEDSGAAVAVWLFRIPITGSLLVRGGERIIWQALGREMPRTRSQPNLCARLLRGPVIMRTVMTPQATAARVAKLHFQFMKCQLYVGRRMTEHGPSQHRKRAWRNYFLPTVPSSLSLSLFLSVLRPRVSKQRGRLIGYACPIFGPLTPLLQVSKLAVLRVWNERTIPRS